MRAVYVLIICLVLAVMDNAPSVITDEISDQNSVIDPQSSDIETMISLEHMVIPPDEKDFSLLTVENVEDLAIFQCTISWNTSVALFESFDVSLNPFDMIFTMPDVPGSLEITGYKFGPGLNGNVVVGNLTLVPSEDASIGDWCYMNITEYMLWNSSPSTMTATIKNASAYIGTITLDVDQSYCERGFPIRCSNDGYWAGAQSFIPSFEHLSSINLYLRRFGTPDYDLVIELRKDTPTGQLIKSRSYNPQEISNFWEWHSIDFLVTTLDVNETYCIVIPGPTDRVDTSFGYEWGYVFKDVYPDGSFWFTRDGGGLWRDLPNSYEFTLRTYGYS